MVEVQVPETSARENTSEGNNSNGTDVLNMVPYQMALPEVIEVILVENATLENEEMW